MSEKKPKRNIDWEGIEHQYRIGIRSLQDIALEFGVSNAGIFKRANAKGWVRDLAAKIKAKADAKVNAAVVNVEVNEAKLLTERQVVEANATVQFRVRIEQREDIKRVKNLLIELLAEAEEQTENNGLFRELGELLRAPDDRGNDKLNDIYKKAMTLPTRVGTVKQITETLEKLINLERQAYGIDDKKTEDSSGLEALLKAVLAHG